MGQQRRTSPSEMFWLQLKRIQYKGDGGFVIVIISYYTESVLYYSQTCIKWLPLENG